MGLLNLFRLGKRATRVAVPGGGSVLMPRPYDVFNAGDYRHRDTGVLNAYRRYHSTMAGTNESNGMVAVGQPSNFKDLGEFVRNTRGALTSRWNSAHESEGRWYGKPETFHETPGEGPNGPELIGKLSVHTVGWTVYDDPGCLYAVNDKRGVMIAVWIRNRDGGERRARSIAERIAASFQR